MIIIILLPPVIIMTCTSSQWGWPAQSCSIFHQILAIGLAPFVINWQKLIKLMIACYWMSKARILIMTSWHYIKFKCLWMIWKELHFNSRMNEPWTSSCSWLYCRGRWWWKERSQRPRPAIRVLLIQTNTCLTVILLLLFCYFVILSPNSINKINK